jgi:hypothetical protein
LLFGTRVNFPVSKINFQNSKRQFDLSCYSSTNCPGHRRGGPPIVSSKVRILALQLSTWPSAYDATPCHEWRSTWGPCFSETFCTSFQHSQELSSNVSTQPIHTHHFGLFKAVVHHDFNLFVGLFVCSITTSSVMLWNLQVYVQLWKVHGHNLDSQSAVRGHGEPAYTCTFTLLDETSEWPSYLTWSFGFPDPDVYSLRPVSVIQFKLSVFPEQWWRWRNL